MGSRPPSGPGAPAADPPLAAAPASRSNIIVVKARLAAVAAVLMVAASALAGCGGGAEPEPRLPSGPVDFVSDFETDAQSANGVAGAWPWSQLNAGEDSQFAVVDDVARRGARSARFDVRSGDQFLPPDSGERANLVWYDSDELPGEVWWYGFSMRLADDFEPTPANGRDQRWTIAFQVHAADKPDPPIDPDPGLFGVRPPIALSVNDDGLSLDVSGGVMTTPDGSGIERQDGRALTGTTGPGGLAQGRWQDIMIGVRYATDQTGVVEVWRRVEGERDFRRAALVEGPNSYVYEPGEGQPGEGVRESYAMPNYLVIGLYRSAYGAPEGPGTRTPPETYTAGGDLTQTIWYDTFVRGTGRAAVEQVLDEGWQEAG